MSLSRDSATGGGARSGGALRRESPTLDLPFVLRRRGALAAWSAPLLALAVGAGILSWPVTDRRAGVVVEAPGGHDLVGLRLAGGGCSAYEAAPRSILRFARSELPGQIVAVSTERSESAGEAGACRILLRVAPEAPAAVRETWPIGPGTAIELRTTLPRGLSLLFRRAMSLRPSPPE